MSPVISYTAGLAIALSLPFVRSQTTITSNTRDPTSGKSIGVVGGTTVVNPGITYWLSGRGDHDVNGNVTNNGNILLSQTDTCANRTGLISRWGNDPGNDGYLYNGPQATFIYNEVDNISPLEVDWDLNTFQNLGTINWCGRGENSGGRFYLSCLTTCENTVSGIIQWEQVGGNQYSLVTWRPRSLLASGSASVGATNNIVNNGAFRIINSVYETNTDIVGNGCFQIYDGSTFYFNSVVAQSPTSNYFPNMSFAFTGANATIRFNPDIYTYGTFSGRIYGFFNDAIIEFEDVIRSMAYDTNQGILTVTMTSGKFVTLNIGPGYEFNGFARLLSTRSGRPLRAIQYVGTIPTQSLPPTCSRTAPRCQPLAPICPTSSIVTVTASATSSGSSSGVSSVTVSTSSVSTSSVSTLSISASSASSVLASTTSSSDSSSLASSSLASSASASSPLASSPSASSSLASSATTSNSVATSPFSSSMSVSSALLVSPSIISPPTITPIASSGGTGIVFPPVISSGDLSILPSGISGISSRLLNSISDVSLSLSATSVVGPSLGSSLQIPTGLASSLPSSALSASLPGVTVVPTISAPPTPGNTITSGPPRIAILSTTILSAGVSGFTSFIQGTGDVDTYLIGVPGVPPSTAELPLATGGLSSLSQSLSTNIISIPATTLENSVTTSTPGTFTPQTTSLTLSNSGFTTYIRGTGTEQTPAGVPTPTVTRDPQRPFILQYTSVNADAPGFTSTIVGSDDYDILLIGVPGLAGPTTSIRIGGAPPLLFRTTTLPAGASGFTSFYPASDNFYDEYLIGVPSSTESLTATIVSAATATTTPTPGPALITSPPIELPRSVFVTITTLSPGASAFTSFIQGTGTVDTFIFGVPGLAGPPTSVYIDGAPPLFFRTTTLPAGASGFTSFYPASDNFYDEYLIGVPSSTESLTATVVSAAITTPTPGTALITSPPTELPRSAFVSITTLSPGASAFTSFIQGTGTVDTFIFGVPGLAGPPTSVYIDGAPPLFFRTTTLPAGASGFTSYLTVSGRDDYLEYLIGVPSSVGSLTTRISTLSEGASGFTSTILPSGTSAGEVVVGLPIDAFYATITTAIPPGATGFTSTIPPSGTSLGQVVVGLPMNSGISLPPPGATSFTSTIPTSGTSGEVVVGLPINPYSSRTTILPPGAPGFTSTIPPSGTALGEVVIGLAADAYISRTTLLSPGATGFTTTVPPSGTSLGEVVIGLPISSYSSRTTILPPGATGFTSTIPASGTALGEVVIGLAADAYISQTTLLPSGATGFTSTIPPSGTALGVVVIGLPINSYASGTTSIPSGGTGPASIIISGGPSPSGVIVGLPINSFATQTTGLPAGATGFTSIVLPSGTSPGEVVIVPPPAVSTAAGNPTGALTGVTNVLPSLISPNSGAANLPSSEALTILTSFPLETPIGATSVMLPGGSSLPNVIGTPSAVPTSGGLSTDVPYSTYLGCLESDLDGPTFSPESGNLTQSSCKIFCSRRTVDAPHAPYKYFAITAGIECHCGDRMINSPIQKRAECNIPCGGNMTQACGGQGVENIWINGRYQPANGGAPGTGGGGYGAPDSYPGSDVPNPPGDNTPPYSGRYPWSPKEGRPGPVPWAPNEGIRPRPRPRPRPSPQDSTGNSSLAVGIPSGEIPPPNPTATQPPASSPSPPAPNEGTQPTPVPAPPTDNFSPGPARPYAAHPPAYPAKDPETSKAALPGPLPITIAYA